MSSRLLTAAQRFHGLLSTLPPTVSRGGSVRLTFDEQVKGLAYLSLDHKEKANAISGGMMLELAQAIETLSNWKVGRALIVRGSGGTFCAGADFDLALALDTSEKGLLMVLNV